MVSAKWEGLRKPWLSSCDLLIENSVKGLAQNGLGGGDKHSYHGVLRSKSWHISAHLKKRKSPNKGTSNFCIATTQRDISKNCPNLSVLINIAGQIIVMSTKNLYYVTYTTFSMYESLQGKVAIVFLHNGQY